MATPGIFDLTVYRGTAFGPVIISAFDINHDPVPMVGWVPIAKVRSALNKPVVIDLQPTITDEATGVTTIPMIADEVTNQFPHGDFIWDLLFERADGNIVGPFVTGAFTITSAVSRA